MSANYLAIRIEELKHQGDFDCRDADYAIAKLAADIGVSSLSPAQRLVWNKQIVPMLSSPFNQDERWESAFKSDWKTHHHVRPPPRSTER